MYINEDGTGAIDCGDVVRGYIRNNKLDIVLSDNILAHDVHLLLMDIASPLRRRRLLKVAYTLDGPEREIVRFQGDRLIIPEVA